MSSAVSPDVAPDDSTLVLAAVAGDAGALGAIYDRYAESLLGLCHSLLRRQSEAEDCLRDTFVTAAARVPQLRDPNLLRAWLFALARHECLIRLEARASEPLSSAPSAAAPIAAEPVEADPLTDPAAAEPLGHDLLTEPFDAAPARSRLDEDDFLFPSPAATTEVLPVGALEAGPIEVAPIDLFDDPSAELLPYAEALPLELSERQQLADYEVAAAIGVPRASAPTIIARARRRAGRAGGPILLGEARAYAAEAAALRAGVLAAAIDPVGHGHPAEISRGSADWKAGWPPPDPFFISSDRRRWGAPLAVLAVLLLAIGAVFGLLSVTGGGGHSASRTTPVAAGSTGLAPSSGGVEAAATTAAAAPGPGNTSGVAIVPPTPSQVPTSTPPPTASSATSPPNGMWTVRIQTDLRKITVTAGRAQAGCAANSVCAFAIPAGLSVTVTDSNGGPASILSDSFSAPPSCASAHGSCTFAVTSNLTIVLTTNGLVRRNG